MEWSFNRARFKNSADNHSSSQSAEKNKKINRRGLFSPLTSRILLVNVLALAILFIGLLDQGRYEKDLIETKLQSLFTQGEMISAALAESAYETRLNGSTALEPSIASPMLRRLVKRTKDRTRLFDGNGYLMADSQSLLGPQGATVIKVELPPIADNDTFRVFVKWLEMIFLEPGRNMPLYQENAYQRAGDYREVERALSGEPSSEIRINESGRLLIGVAVPVQRFKKVIGVVFITHDAKKIDEKIHAYLILILSIFAVALCVTVCLSFYLSGTIVRPLRRLATSADRVRTTPSQVKALPKFQGRNDEIGDLAEALNAMTAALSERLDAIDRFAADVSHELKNPLTSALSAAETAARIDDAQQQRKLMAIIKDDIIRCDRTITEISEASRLDAQLSRDENEIIDLGPLLATLVEVSQSGSPFTNEIHYVENGTGPYTVLGKRGPIERVFKNLFDNALSFSPPNGEVKVKVRRDNENIFITVEDEGPGIREGSLEKIFNRFYSERPESEQFGTHSGLGLSMVRQIIAAYRGEIVVKNLKNSNGKIMGACFVVSLPAC